MKNYYIMLFICKTSPSSKKSRHICNTTDSNQYLLGIEIWIELYMIYVFPINFPVFMILWILNIHMFLFCLNQPTANFFCLQCRTLIKRPRISMTMNPGILLSKNALAIHGGRKGQCPTLYISCSSIMHVWKTTLQQENKR